MIHMRSPPLPFLSPIPSLPVTSRYFPLLPVTSRYFPCQAEEELYNALAPKPPKTEDAHAVLEKRLELTDEAVRQKIIDNLLEPAT
jgi:hypothetical protein